MHFLGPFLSRELVELFGNRGAGVHGLPKEVAPHLLSDLRLFGAADVRGSPQGDLRLEAESTPGLYQAGEGLLHGTGDLL